MYDLPRRFNFGMIDDGDGGGVETPVTAAQDWPPYPKNAGLGKQHSVEYWMMGSLLANEEDDSEAIRVLDPEIADAFFVPFFSSLSYNLHVHETGPQTEIDRHLQVYIYILTLFLSSHSFPFLVNKLF